MRRLWFFFLLGVLVIHCTAMHRAMLLSDETYLDTKVGHFFGWQPLKGVLNTARREAATAVDIWLIFEKSLEHERIAGYCMSSELDPRDIRSLDKLFDKIKNNFSHVERYTINVRDGMLTNSVLDSYACNFALLCMCEKSRILLRDATLFKHISSWLFKHPEGGEREQQALVRAILARSCLTDLEEGHHYDLARDLCQGLISDSALFAALPKCWRAHVYYMLASLSFAVNDQDVDYAVVKSACNSLLNNDSLELCLPYPLRANVYFMLAEACLAGPVAAQDCGLVYELCTFVLENNVLDTALSTACRAKIRYMLAEVCYGPMQFLYDDTARQRCLEIVNNSTFDGSLEPVLRANIRYMLACMYNDGRGGGTDYELAHYYADTLKKDSPLYNALHPVRRAYIQSLLASLRRAQNRQPKTVLEAQFFPFEEEQNGIAYASPDLREIMRRTTLQGY